MSVRDTRIAALVMAEEAMKKYAETMDLRSEECDGCHRQHFKNFSEHQRWVEADAMRQKISRWIKGEQNRGQTNG